MRPIGVTVTAIITWLRASLYALGGVALIGVGHLSAKLVSTVESDSFFENLLYYLGKTLGIGALVIALAYVAVGFGLWIVEELGTHTDIGSGNHLGPIWAARAGASPDSVPHRA